ncbi:MAG: alanine acetyltransferase [Cyanobium sp. CACIAM 14]|nr:MAG: alanine acetyltransferase [Cyanobium sp. CACIAM 14]
MAAVSSPSLPSPPGLFPLGPAHAGSCRALDLAALGGLWSLAQWQRELEEEGRPCVGLRQAGSLLAMACGWLVLDELHITLVAVDPQHRRRGLGRRVLEELLAVAVRAGATRATLEVAAGNGAGLALYASLGFRTAGIRHGYYRNGEDALIQWLSMRTVGECG